jgi:hypothetical protein
VHVLGRQQRQSEYAGYSGTRCDHFEESAKHQLGL